MTVTTKYPLAIEVFPYADNESWGYLTSDAPVTADVKQECAYWRLNIPGGDPSEGVDVYYHGSKPSLVQRHRINSEIFKFYFRLMD